MNEGARPIVGVMCCNEVASRPVQVVATRFIEPLAMLAGATVVLIPAVTSATDIGSVAAMLDGLLLTGSRSNVAAERYGGAPDAADGTTDPARDHVALTLADRMIAAAKPVFGICRGLQEINVLFGGTLSHDLDPARHHHGSWDAPYEGLFDHRHGVTLTDRGRLHAAIGVQAIEVNSVHEQGIDRLGAGLSVEAVAHDDGLIEAVAARPYGADVLAVQWHPEWDFRRSQASRAFFGMIGTAIRGSAIARNAPWVAPPVPTHTPAGSGLRGH